MIVSELRSLCIDALHNIDHDADVLINERIVAVSPSHPMPAYSTRCLRAYLLAKGAEESDVVGVFTFPEGLWEHASNGSVWCRHVDRPRCHECGEEVPTSGPDIGLCECWC